MIEMVKNNLTNEDNISIPALSRQKIYPRSLLFFYILLSWGAVLPRVACFVHYCSFYCQSISFNSNCINHSNEREIGRWDYEKWNRDLKGYDSLTGFERATMRTTGELWILEGSWEISVMIGSKPHLGRCLRLEIMFSFYHIING